MKRAARQRRHGQERFDRCALALAEGIEDRQQLARLRELGCTPGQGYLFARPLTADDATALLVAPPALAA